MLSNSLPMAWLLVSLPVPMAALAQSTLPTQNLPIQARVCGPVLGEGERQPSPSSCVDLEVPATPQEYAIGLMGRSHLPPEQGMWFRFDQKDASFWMRNTLIPLDLVFLEQHHGNGSLARIVQVSHGVPPCLPRLPCPSYSAGQPIDHVVELAAGEAQRRNWGEGTVLDLNWLEGFNGESGRSQSTQD